MTDRTEDVERVLRWAVIERGTATLADELGPDVVVPGGPRRFTPPGAAIAGPVVLLRRQPPVRRALVAGGLVPQDADGVLRLPAALAASAAAKLMTDPAGELGGLLGRA